MITNQSRKTNFVEESFCIAMNHYHLWGFLSVQLFVCLSVRPLTTPSFLDRFVQLRYQWISHAKGKVLRPFENKSMQKKKNNDKKFVEESFCTAMSHYHLWRCLSVRLFVCLSVRPLTTPSFLDRFVQLWYLWIPHAKGKILRPFENK